MTIEAARVVNMVQYMPVAVATAGCMFRFTSKELKIVPGDTPAKPENIATKKAIDEIFAIVLPENS